jgi:hypothetical protein
VFLVPVVRDSDRKTHPPELLEIGPEDGFLEE